MEYVGLAMTMAVLGAIVWRIRQGAPFLASNSQAIDEMVSMADWRSRRVAELGSGDGRLAISLGERSAKVVGYEFNRLLVLLARHRVRCAGLQGAVKVTRQNFWRVDLSNFDAVTVFAMPHVMDRLSRKLMTECVPGTLVVSHAFSIPNLTLLKKTERALLYEVPLSKTG